MSEWSKRVYRSIKSDSLPLEHSHVLPPSRSLSVVVAPIPPVEEPLRSLQIILVVPDNSNILHKDVAMPQGDSDDVRFQTGSEEGHHDGIHEGEVAG